VALKGGTTNVVNKWLVEFIVNKPTILPATNLLQIINNRSKTKSEPSSNWKPECIALLPPPKKIVAMKTTF